LIFSGVAPVEPVKPVKKGSDLFNYLLAVIAAGHSIQTAWSANRWVVILYFRQKDAFGVSLQMGGALV